MAILNNTVVTVDAVLTTKGRELLARNDGSFQITQFSLADDEVDYTLYNPNHPSGSAFYGEAIENMPVIQAFPNDTQIMRYKLATLPRGTSRLPVVSLGYNTITIKQGASLTITPQTLNYLGATSTFEANGYVATIADIRLLSSFQGTGITVSTVGDQNLNTTTGAVLSKSVIGTSFTLTGTTVNTLYGSSLTTLATTITVIGRDSGARITIPVNIQKVSTT
jgi:ACT domain-containing protein